MAALLERFTAKVGPADSQGCWPWLAGKDRDGYGRMRVGKRTLQAHTVAFMLYRGELPEWADELDHTCRNHGCVNPWHLDPVTSQENTNRGLHAAGRLRVTHCRRGHEYTPHNTYSRPSGRRECIACREVKSRARPGRT